MKDIIHTAAEHGEVSLSPGRTKAVLKAVFDGGSPGHSEEWVIRMGPDSEGQHDVLWHRSDALEEMTPLAWAPKGQLKGKALALALLKAWLEAQRDCEDAEGPPFAYYKAPKGSPITAKDIERIIDDVWEPEA
jgi:hypothetical protein